MEKWGFSDWELSAPEPHGSLNNNLGAYRDVGFADAACAFLRRKGLGVDYSRINADADRNNPGGPSPDPSKPPPWFAVASFVTPHDIATYPGVIAQALPPRPDQQPVTLPNGQPLPPPTSQSVFGPLTVPKQRDRMTLPKGGTMQAWLNPLDFPQDCARPPLTMNDPLTNKGRPREGVLFITDDEITAPLPDSRDAYAKKSDAEYAIFERAVEMVRAGTPRKGAVPQLTPGSVRQPNHVRCVRTPRYKLARYFDPAVVRGKWTGRQASS